MPKKTKIIFIIVFIIAGIIVLGIYLYNNRKSSNTTNTSETNNTYQKFNPFGNSNITDNNNSNTTDKQTEGELVSNSRFHKITDFAVSGATFFEDTRPLPKKETPPTEQKVEVVKTNETKTPIVKKIDLPKIIEPTTEIVPAIRYVERATGHVYQMYLDTKVEGKISNTTIPSIYEAIFSGDASNAIYRYISSDKSGITSFVASIGGKDSSFLPPDILNLSLSPDKSKFFYLVKNSKGVTGFIKSFNETKTTQVFSSSFSEWLSQWVTINNVFLTTKPSYAVKGSIFSLNTTNGTLSKIFGGIPGLTTLANKDGSLILYSASLEKGPTLNIFNTKNHTSLDLNLYGLPEKCIWSNKDIYVYCALPNTIYGNQYPDSWYQGVTSFEDRIISINTQTKDVINMGDSEKEIPVDGINLFLNKDESQLFFTNKKDGTLWSFDIK